VKGGEGPCASSHGEASPCGRHTGNREACLALCWSMLIPSSATLCCLMPCEDARVPMRCTSRVDPRWAWQRHRAHPVSIKARFAVHRRMTTRLCPPQGGQQVTTGSGRTIRIGWQPMGCACKIIRRRVSEGMAQRACIKPKWRTFRKPSGRTCWRKALNQHSCHQPPTHLLWP
jgi:hypothetical protein